MNISERHHYIPEFIIKGFTNSEGKVAVFNKEKMRMETLMKSPKQVFFDWNRNNFEKDNEVTDFVEKLYSNCENKFAPVYQRIIEDVNGENLVPIDLLHLIHYISILNSSLPVKDREIEELIKLSKKEDFFLNIIDLKTKKESIDADEYFEKFKEEPAFMQSVKIMKAIADFMKNKTYLTLDNWKIYSSENNIGTHLIGDNPIILRDENVSSIYSSELIFQFSRTTSLIHTKGKTIKAISPEDKAKNDMLIFLQSDKYVAGPDFAYLENIAKLCIEKGYNNPKVIDYLKESIFELFQ